MQVVVRTDCGLVRTQNEDYADVFYNQENIMLAILADGMGGHQAGDVASKYLVENLGLAWRQNNSLEQDEIKQWLDKNIKRLNSEIYQLGMSKELLEGMGTTLVLLVVLEDELLIAHVGDSRAYLITEDTIKQLTTDHSFPYELYKQGLITKEMAETHQKKNELTRAIGMPIDVQIDFDTIKLEAARYLLCSDGLTNMLDDETIMKIVNGNRSLEKRAELLLKKANKAGGKDNITVILLEIDGKG